MKSCITQQCSFHEIGSATGCTQNIGSCQNYTTKGLEISEKDKDFISSRPIDPEEIRKIHNKIWGIKEMKKYKMEVKVVPLSPISEMERNAAVSMDPVEDSAGEWVTWADHEAEIARIEDIYERRIKELKKDLEKVYKKGYFTGLNTAHLESPECMDINKITELYRERIRDLKKKNQALEIKLKPTECNCEEMLERMSDFYGDKHSLRYCSWICPAHGYKRR